MICLDFRNRHLTPSSPDAPGPRGVSPRLGRPLRWPSFLMALAVVSACLVSVGSASVGAPRWVWGQAPGWGVPRDAAAGHALPARRALACPGVPASLPWLSRACPGSPRPGPLFSPFLAVLSGRQVPGTGTHLGAGMAHLSEGRAAT